jgi:hypothetical protein
MMLIVTCSHLASDSLSRESVRVYYNMAMYHDGVLWELVNVVGFWSRNVYMYMQIRRIKKLAPSVLDKINACLTV